MALVSFKRLPGPRDRAAGRLPQPSRQWRARASRVQLTPVRRRRFRGVAFGLRLGSGRGRCCRAITTLSGTAGVAQAQSDLRRQPQITQTRCRDEGLSFFYDRHYETEDRVLAQRSWRLINDPLQKAGGHLRAQLAKHTKPRGFSLCRCAARRTNPATARTAPTAFATRSSPIRRRTNRGVRRQVDHDLRQPRHLRARRHCTDAKGSVQGGRHARIDPDGAASRRSSRPSRNVLGALSYAIGGRKSPIAPRPAVHHRLEGWPVRGVGRRGAGCCVRDGASKEHYTLCRCGASKNKPFCDGPTGRSSSRTRSNPSRLSARCPVRVVFPSRRRPSMCFMNTGPSASARRP